MSTPEDLGLLNLLDFVEGTFERAEDNKLRPVLKYAPVARTIVDYNGQPQTFNSMEPVVGNGAPNVDAVIANSVGQVTELQAFDVTFTGAVDPESDPFTYSIPMMRNCSASKVTGIAPGETVTFTSTQPAAAGNCTFSAQAMDSNGNMSGVTDTFEVTVIAAAPTWAFTAVNSTFDAMFTGASGSHTATVSTMHDGIDNAAPSIAVTTLLGYAPALQPDANAMIVMDMGKVYNLKAVGLRHVDPTTYDADLYGGLDSHALEFSSTGDLWTTVFQNIGPFQTGVTHEFAVNAEARYVRIRAHGNSQIAVAEFYPVFA